MRTNHLQHLAMTLMTLAMLSLPAHAQTVDGVVLIDQALVETGGITPGDDPGFPATISASGSYRLSSNLTVPDADTTAVEINSDNVTLDLNGFSILGPEVAGFGHGVFANQTNVTVANGTVRGMGGDGVRLVGNSNRVEKVRALFNLAGIRVGDASAVTGCTANVNRGTGIAVSNGGSVVGNVARNNLQFGLALLSGTGYTQNVLTGNATDVIGGINLGHNVCGLALCP